MTDIEIPDNEDAACALDNAVLVLGKICWFEVAERVSGAARRLRADAEEIARLEAKVDRLSLCLRETTDRLSARSAELASSSVDAGKSSPDPLTRIAAALERPSREWVAVGIHRALVAQEGPVSINRVERIAWAIAESDALLAEMGEG